VQEAVGAADDELRHDDDRDRLRIGSDAAARIAVRGERGARRRRRARRGSAPARRSFKPKIAAVTRATAVTQTVSRTSYAWFVEG
jgi:hypothetical protein